MADWLIQINEIDLTQAGHVADAVKKAGGEFLTVQVYPSTKTIEFWDGEEPTGKAVIPYGSTKLRELSQERNWDGVFFNENFDTTVWTKNRDDMLNSDAVIMTVSETQEYLKDRPLDLPIFIRPRAGMKVFAGMRTIVGDILNWKNSPAFSKYQVKPETVVSIAPDKQIDAETRWFIVGGKVIDGSVYRLRGQRIMIHVEDERVIQEAQALADKWLPIHTCVMDTAETPDGLKVIEFNCFNSSGFYKNDIDKVISAVNALFQPT